VEDSQGYCLNQTKVLPEGICRPVAPLNRIGVGSNPSPDFGWNER
jgi:hypothetical protein